MTRTTLGPLTHGLIVEEPSELLDELLEKGGMTTTRFRGSPDEEELIELINDCQAQVVFKRSKVQITRKVVESCPSLLAVQLCCIGDDSVDKAATAEHGVMVFNDPVSNGRSVVELVVAHLIALSRRLYEDQPVCKAGTWQKSNTERYEIRGKTLGVLGLGNIGRQVARTCDQLGMRIRFFDSRHAASEVGVEFGWDEVASVEELFRGSDYVSAHLSATDVHGDTNEWILDDVLSQLGADRPESSPRVFLNLSRGFLHSADALIDAVKSQKIRRAAVDVYPEEPGLGKPWSNPYEGLERIAVTPHIGAATQEAQPRIARRVASTTLAFSHYGSLRDCVYSPKNRLQLLEEGAGAGQVLLAVAHATTRGTKRSIDDVIYEAGASNISSIHQDFSRFDLAYDLAQIDRPLSEAKLAKLAEDAKLLTGDTSAIRSVRQIVVGANH